MTPDLTRYSRSTQHLAAMTLMTIIAGEFIVNELAIMIARTLQTADVESIMSQAAGGAGPLVVILSTLRVNDSNLYSSSLGVINAIEGICGKKLQYRYTTLAVGLVGTLLSVPGILDRLIDFITFLGVTFPPILGIKLVDYLLLRTHLELLDRSRLQGKVPDDNETPTLGWVAIIATFIGSAVGLVIDWGVPTLNSLLVSCFIYCLLTLASRSRIVAPVV